MVRINLLPWRQRRRERQQRVFLCQLVASLLVAVALVASAELYLHGLVEQQRRGNTLAERRNAELDGELAEIDTLNHRREEILARLRVLRGLWADRSTTVEILDQLAHGVVAGLHFVSLSRQDDTLIAHGTAQSNDRVAALMRNLRDSPRFAVPNLKNIGGDQSAAYGEHGAAFELVFAIERAPQNAGTSTP